MQGTSERPPGHPGGLSPFPAAATSHPPTPIHRHRPHTQEEQGGRAMLPERTEYDLVPRGDELEENRDWWADARCNDQAGTMTGLFFSEELQDIARAKEICALCPVMATCLEGALERRE